MVIFIDGKLASIKKGTTFDYVSENRYFSGADAYSMSIVFPLKGCPENLAIFGNINRKDVQAKKILFDCEIRDKAFSVQGSITITEITDIEVKTQFLEGQSITNYVDDFDNIYINELELGYPSTSTSHLKPNHLYGKSIDQGLNYIALPWVNNTSGNLQNEPQPREGLPSETWASSASALSYQPYLIYLLQLIGNSIGYSFDLTELRASNYRFLIVCNTLPAAWHVNNWAKALPHLTLTEFFEQLELFLNCEFVIDHRAKSITFRFSKYVQESAEETLLDNIVDEYSATIESASDCKYRANVNLKFAECSHRKWKFYSCQWFVDKMKNEDLIFRYYGYETNLGHMYNEYNYIQQLDMALANVRDFVQTQYSGASPGHLLYCKDYDTYFVVVNVGTYIVDPDQPENLEGNKHYINTIETVNMFGESIVDENGDTKELKIVPAWIDTVGGNRGKALFLECGEYSEITSEVVPFNYAQQVLEEGPQNTSSKEYIDKLYLAFWTGYALSSMYGNFLAFPMIDRVFISADSQIEFDTGVSMRLRSKAFPEHTMIKIDGSKKYTFKFLADTIPNVRSVFYIRGRKYLCSKITATFIAGTGMSQLLKGEFYEII